MLMLRVEDQKIYEQEKRDWTKTRSIAYYSFISVRATTKAKSPQAWWPFPWEDEKPSITPAQKRLLDSMYNDKRFPDRI